MARDHPDAEPAPPQPWARSPRSRRHRSPSPDAGQLDDVDGAAAGAVAAFVPAGSPVYFEVSTDGDGAQWQQVDALGQAIPGPSRRVAKVTGAWTSEGVDFVNEIKPLVGDGARRRRPRADVPTPAISLKATSQSARRSWAADLGRRGVWTPTLVRTPIQGGLVKAAKKLGEHDGVDPQYSATRTRSSRSTTAPLSSATPPPTSTARSTRTAAATKTMAGYGPARPTPSPTSRTRSSPRDSSTSAPSSRSPERRRADVRNSSRAPGSRAGRLARRVRLGRERRHPR